MATINVTGKIGKFYDSGKGFSLVEEIQGRDKMYKTYFNVWTTNLKGLTVGAIVNVIGNPSASGYLGQDGTAKASIGIYQPNVSATQIEEDVF
jgi:hypothetical protein